MDVGTKSGQISHSILSDGKQMCGYCIESIVMSTDFYDLENYDELFGVVVLQESKDTKEIIRKMDRMEDFSVPIDLAFMKLWEGILFDGKGVDFGFIVENFRRQEIDSFLDELTSFSPSSMYGFLGDPESYACPNFSNELSKRLPFLVEESEGILNSYLSFWVGVEGGGLPPTEKMMNQTISFSTMPIRSKDDWRYFYKFYPYYFLSLLIVKKCRPESDVIRRIAMETVRYAPDFYGYDLWLQREAFETCVDKLGVGFFLDDIEVTRMSLVCRCLERMVVKDDEIDLLRGKLLALNDDDYDGVFPSRVVSLIDGIIKS